MLGDALVVCLHAAGFDDVVNLGPNPHHPSGRFDAAVVSTDDIDADVVIDLRGGTADFNAIVLRLEAVARDEAS